MTMKHTLRDAANLLYLLQKTISKDAKLIGSFEKLKESDHDIDILLPNHKRTMRMRDRLQNLLEAKSFYDTDWDGIFFRDTRFGDVDIFFTIKNFD